MNISYGTEVPRRRGRQSKYAHIVREFLESDKDNMRFEFDEYKPARAAYQALHMLSKRDGRFKAIMRGWSVYCIKED